MKKIIRKLLPELLIFRTLAFDISVTASPIQMFFFQFQNLWIKGYKVSDFKRNLFFFCSGNRATLTWMLFEISFLTRRNQGRLPHTNRYHMSHFCYFVSYINVSRKKQWMYFTCMWLDQTIIILLWQGRQSSAQQACYFPAQADVKKRDLSKTINAFDGKLSQI